MDDYVPITVPQAGNSNSENHLQGFQRYFPSPILLLLN